MGRFKEWLKQRDSNYAEEATGGPYTVASAQPVQQAPSPFGGVPPELTGQLQSLGQAGSGVMQRAQQIMQQRPGTNMSSALQAAMGEYQKQQQQGPPPGTPPAQQNQFRMAK
jgi:hypothetical protein